MHIHPNIRAFFQNDTKLWLVLLILLPWLLSSLNAPNNDFDTFIKTVQDWTKGNTQLYDSLHVYFNYLPWSLLVYLPFSILPPPIGHVLFNSISLGLLIWLTWYLNKPIGWWQVAMALTTVYTGMLIKQGQWDALVLSALILGWIGYQKKNPWLIGIAIVGMTTKYTNIILPLLLLLFSIRSWSKIKLIEAAVIPLFTILISFFISGWDWPVRYFHLMTLTFTYFRSYEVITLFSTTIYPVSYRLLYPPLGSILIVLLSVLSIYLLFRKIRKGLTLDILYLATGLNLVISPYFTFHHLIYLAPAHSMLLKKHRVWGILLFGAAIIDLLLMWFGIGVIIYPALALLILLIIGFYEIYYSKRRPINQVSPLPVN